MKDPRFSADALAQAEIEDLKDDIDQVRAEIAQTIDDLASRLHIRYEGARARRLVRASGRVMAVAAAAGLIALGVKLAISPHLRAHALH